MNELAMGMVGLGVMGRNLALNIEEKGFSVAAYDAWPDPVDKFVAQNPGKQIGGFKTPAELVAALRRPRRIIMLVKAGDVVDKTIATLRPLLQPGDMLVDAGNEYFLNTERRDKELEGAGIRYFGMGVSGGEQGARRGPSMMPGGDKAAYEDLAPVLTKIAAQHADGPCVTFIGPGGSGHYVKMVHNGIEYGDMQLIAEAYDVLRTLGGLSNPELADVFAEWNEGELQSYLIEITAEIFRMKDPHGKGELVDQILDATAMKGTGKWTVQDAAELGAPLVTVATSVEARIVSSMKEERVKAAKLMPGPTPVHLPASEKKRLIADVRAALYASKCCSYAQGMNLLRLASAARKWDLRLGELARIWQAGCIIRARFLGRIKAAYDRDAGLSNLLIDPSFREELAPRQDGWRSVVAACTTSGLPLLTMSASLGYYDMMRRERLPANLTQAQRDFFGAHTYKRIDREGDFHTVERVMTEKNPLREGMPEERTVRPTAIVIFGALGDLTKRKLFPAIYNLAQSRLLPAGFAAVGVARRPKPDFEAEMRENVGKFSRRKPVDEATWNELAKGISYVQGEFHEADTYAKLKAELERLDAERGTRKNRVFYLAVSPDQVTTIVKGLREAELVTPPSLDKDAPYQHVVVEKPFGEDLPSARTLNRELQGFLAESQIYRIDHYLGKETVQNLLVFRFGNTIFEPLWSRQHVDHVQITVAEEIGVEGRGKFYEGIGITRDIVENHALQLLTLVAMDPPSSWGADAVRDNKVQVLRSLRPIRGADVLKRTVRGQYAAGVVRGDKVGGYRDEPDVAKDSKTETYMAMTMMLDNWRWAGVPFYLRSGKRLAKRLAEVVLHFRPLPHRLFSGQSGAGDEPNQLVMRIQPDEGISLRFATKVPGGAIAVRDVAMDFRYGSAFGSSTPEAYERLILDAMRGDATLFTRADEVEAQWGFIDPILDGWREQGAPVASYDAGSWGPAEADLLLEPGDTWRRP